MRPAGTSPITRREQPALLTPTPSLAPCCLPGTPSLPSQTAPRALPKRRIPSPPAAEPELLPSGSSGAHLRLPPAPAHPHRPAALGRRDDGARDQSSGVAAVLRSAPPVCTAVCANDCRTPRVLEAGCRPPSPCQPAPPNADSHQGHVHQAGAVQARRERRELGSRLLCACLPAARPRPMPSPPSSITRPSLPAAHPPARCPAGATSPSATPRACCGRTLRAPPRAAALSSCPASAARLQRTGGTGACGERGAAE